MDTDGQPRCWFRWCTLQARPASEVTCGHSSVLQAFDTGSVSKPFQEDEKRIWRIVVVFPFFWPPSRTRTQPHTQRCNIYILFTSMLQYICYVYTYIHAHTHIYDIDIVAKSTYVYTSAVPRLFMGWRHTFPNPYTKSVNQAFGSALAWFSLVLRASWEESRHHLYLLYLQVGNGSCSSLTCRL